MGTPFPPRFRTTALSLKDALRGLRYVLRRGRDVFDVPATLGPPPVSAAARTLLSQFDRLAQRADQTAGGLLHRLMDVPGTGRHLPVPAHTPNADHVDSPEAFAQAVYWGLSHLLDCLGARDSAISEVEAAAAYGTERAAALMMALYDRRVIRDVAVPVDAAPGAAPAALTTQALFGFCLWLLIEPPEPPLTDEMLLEDCAEVAQALARKLPPGRPDAVAMAALFSRLAPQI
jgi:hypothetical protein